MYEVREQDASRFTGSPRFVPQGSHGSLTHAQMAVGQNQWDPLLGR